MLESVSWEDQPFQSVLDHWAATQAYTVVDTLHLRGTLNSMGIPDSRYKAQELRGRPFDALANLCSHHLQPTERRASIDHIVTTTDNPHCREFFTKMLPFIYYYLNADTFDPRSSPCQICRRNPAPRPLPTTRTGDGSPSWITVSPPAPCSASLDAPPHTLISCHVWTDSPCCSDCRRDRRPPSCSDKIEAFYKQAPPPVPDIVHLKLCEYMYIY